ncbi:MAG: nucleoside triphosphate pyrophosphohydrolase [Thermoleophilia bacterium]
MSGDSLEGEAPPDQGDASGRRDTIVSELAALYDLTAVLRRECPWDRAQTQHDIVAYTLEETYELIDAVRALAPPAGEGAAAPDSGPATAAHRQVRGELGDLLFQVYFLARVAEDEGWYHLGDVAAGIREKLVRRHPHIFGEAEAETPDDVRRTWDDIKRHTEGREGIFHEVPSALSAALYAQKVQQRAATVGFDWREAADVFDKIREETEELELALAGTPEELSAEVGDLLFAVVNLARKLEIDPELELRAASHRFQGRVEGAAAIAAADGGRFEDMDLETQETYYQRAKKGMEDA